MKRAGGSPSPLRCSAARAARSASRGARCLPRPSIPRRTRPTVQAATTKITNIATTKAVTNTPFRQSLSTRRCQAAWGRNCLTGRTPRLRGKRCRWNSSRAHSLPSQDHGVGMETADSCFQFHHSLQSRSDRHPARFASFLARGTTEPAQRQYPTQRGMLALYTACMPCTARASYVHLRMRWQSRAPSGVERVRRTLTARTPAVVEAGCPVIVQVRRLTRSHEAVRRLRLRLHRRAC
jgi:hypothetical protein